MKENSIFEETLKEYIFKGNSEERKKNFEIVWGIWENFEKIKEDMRKKVVKIIIDTLKKDYEDKGYEIKVEPEFLEGKKCKGVYLFKKDWKDGEDFILAYGIEPQGEKHRLILFGIKKFDDKKPFEGDWRKTKPQGYELLQKIEEKFKGLEGKKDISEWWIIFNFYDHPYKNLDQKEVYLKMLEDNGYEDVALHYTEKLKELINSTEDLVDEFVKKYIKAS